MKKVKLTYTYEMEKQDELWWENQEDATTMQELFKQILEESKQYGLDFAPTIYSSRGRAIINLYKNEKAQQGLLHSTGQCDSLIRFLENELNTVNETGGFINSSLHMKMKMLLQQYVEYYKSDILYDVETLKATNIGFEDTFIWVLRQSGTHLFSEINLKHNTLLSLDVLKRYENEKVFKIVLKEDISQSTIEEIKDVQRLISDYESFYNKIGEPNMISVLFCNGVVYKRAVDFQNGYKFDTKAFIAEVYAELGVTEEEYKNTKGWDVIMWQRKHCINEL